MKKMDLFSLQLHTDGLIRKINPLSRFLMVLHSLLFLPAPVMFALMGMPQGSGLFTELAKIKGKKLPVTEKTLRKLYKHPEKVTVTTQRKIEAFMVESLPMAAEFFDSESRIDEPQQMTLTAFQWREAVRGIRAASANDYFPLTFEFINDLISRETELYQQILSKKLSIERLEAFFQCPLTQSLSKGMADIPKELLASLENSENSTFVDQLKGHPDWPKFVTYTVVSLLMRILAHAEHEWSQSIDGYPYEKPRQSHIRRLLPAVGENGEWITPIKQLLVRWRYLGKFSSWEDMARSMPGASDIDDKTRKLMGWLSGEHLPASDAIGAWLQVLLPDEEDTYIRYVRYSLFEIATFMSRLLSEFRKPSHAQLGADFIAAAFGSFNQHFSEFEDRGLYQRAP